jgi:signal transduction histidine kinase
MELLRPLVGLAMGVKEVFADPYAELLATSTLDKHQRELCDTIGTCGQVLLDTLSDILENTKVRLIVL